MANSTISGSNGSNVSGNQIAYKIGVAGYEQLISDMNASRHRIHDGIVDIRNFTQKLAEVWQGQDAEAVIDRFMNALKRLYGQEKVLNALTWQMTQYLEELKANEAAIRNSANSV